MGTLTIRNVDDTTHGRLRERAAQNGRSVEAEVRSILVDVVHSPTRNLLIELHDEMGHHDFALELPTRADPPREVLLP